MSLSEIGSAIQRMRSMLQHRPDLVKPVGMVECDKHHASRPSIISPIPSNRAQPRQQSLCERREGMSKPMPLSLSRSMNTQMSMTPMQHHGGGGGRSPDARRGSVFDRLATGARTPISSVLAAGGSDRLHLAQSAPAYTPTGPSVVRRASTFAKVKVPGAVDTHDVRDRIQAALKKPSIARSPTNLNYPTTTGSSRTPHHRHTSTAGHSGRGGASTSQGAAEETSAPQIFNKLYEQARRQQQKKESEEKARSLSNRSNRSNSFAQQQHTPSGTQSRGAKPTGWRAPPSTAPSAPPIHVIKPKVPSGSVWDRLTGPVGTQKKPHGSVATVAKTGGLSRPAAGAQKPTRPAAKPALPSRPAAAPAPKAESTTKAAAVISRLYGLNQAKEKRLQEQRLQIERERKELSDVTVYTRHRRPSIPSQQPVQYVSKWHTHDPTAHEEEEDTHQHHAPATSEPKSKEKDSYVDERAHTRAEAIEIRHQPGSSYSIDDDDQVGTMIQTPGGTWRQKFTRSSEGQQSESAGTEPPCSDDDDVTSEQKTVQAAIQALYVSKSHETAAESIDGDVESSDDDGAPPPAERIGTGRPDIVEAAQRMDSATSSERDDHHLNGHIHDDGDVMTSEDEKSDVSPSEAHPTGEGADRTPTDSESPEFKRPVVPKLHFRVLQYNRR